MAKNSPESPPSWHLRLYVVGETFKSKKAIQGVEQICAEELKNTCRLEIIDLLKDPASAREDQILAVPALVCVEPLSGKKMIGDMQDKKAVMEWLELDDES